MSKATEGVKIHFLASGMTVAGRVWRRGDELLITQDIRAACTDRHGFCVLDLTADEQVERFGRVHWRPGVWPEGQSRLEPGSPEWQDAREAARRGAHAIQNEQERVAALRRVTEEYGPAGPTSRTLATYQR